MNGQYTAKVTIDIAAPPAEVWKGLTDPDLIREYFFGTEAESDWEEGSPLTFRGEWQGAEYLDKGTILKNVPERMLKYNYLSSFSGLEDIPENYADITYELAEEIGGTRLKVTQEGIATEEARNHSQDNWANVLSDLKDLLEARQA